MQSSAVALKTLQAETEPRSGDQMLMFIYVLIGAGNQTSKI